MMTIDWRFWSGIKGFMDRVEAERLYRLALQAAGSGPVLEVGSYCGKSAYILGSACKESDSVLYSIDHHRGSEEQQPGETYFDPDLFDQASGRINTLPFFQKNLAAAGLEDYVIPIVARSGIAGKKWQNPLSLVFIDGGHSFEAACEDYRTWSGHVQSGGFLVFHDVFTDPEKGGQAPRRVYEIARASGDYKTIDLTLTLGVLEKR